MPEVVSTWQTATRLQGTIYGQDTVVENDVNAVSIADSTPAKGANQKTL